MDLQDAILVRVEEGVVGEQSGGYNDLKMECQQYNIQHQSQVDYNNENNNNRQFNQYLSQAGAQAGEVPSHATEQLPYENQNEAPNQDQYSFCQFCGPCRDCHCNDTADYQDERQEEQEMQPQQQFNCSISQNHHHQLHHLQQEREVQPLESICTSQHQMISYAHSGRTYEAQTYNANTTTTAVNNDGDSHLYQQTTSQNNFWPSTTPSDQTQGVQSLNSNGEGEFKHQRNYPQPDSNNNNNSYQYFYYQQEEQQQQAQYETQSFSSSFREHPDHNNHHHQGGEYQQLNVLPSTAPICKRSNQSIVEAVATNELHCYSSVSQPSSSQQAAIVTYHHNSNQPTTHTGYHHQVVNERAYLRAASAPSSDIDTTKLLGNRRHQVNKQFSNSSPSSRKTSFDYGASNTTKQTATNQAIQSLTANDRGTTSDAINRRELPPKGKLTDVCPTRLVSIASTQMIETSSGRTQLAHALPVANDFSYPNYQKRHELAQQMKKPTERSRRSRVKRGQRVKSKLQFLANRSYKRPSKFFLSNFMNPFPNCCRSLIIADRVSGKLWEFIRDLLLSERTNPSCIAWERREDGIFKFIQSDKVAKMWGERKQNPKMTYEKLSRAMRYYYKSEVLLPVFGRRLVYKFGPNATGWREAS